MASWSDNFTVEGISKNSFPISRRLWIFLMLLLPISGMRKCRFTIFLLAFVPLAQAQPSGLGSFRVRAVIPSNKVDRVIDSLRTLLVQSNGDTAKINTLLLLRDAYQNKGSLKRDSSFYCYHQALECPTFAKLINVVHHPMGTP